MIKAGLQKTRRIFIFISLLLFPVTIYYFSPFLPIMAASEGIIAGSLMVFLFLFIVSMFSGRFFCGWVCPSGAVQELAAEISGRKVNRKKISWIKYPIWTSWILLLSYFIFKAGGISKADFLYQTEYGISISSIYSIIIYYVVIIVLFIPVLFAGKRGACHTICWMAPFMIFGQKLGKMLFIPSLQIKKKTDNCIECGLCSEQCLMSIDVLNEIKKDTLSVQPDCILCGVCVSNCPQKTLGFHFGK